MTLSEELKWRGFVNQTTVKNLSALDKLKDKSFYHGYDASIDSLTIGNLAAVMLDKVFIRHGWGTVILAGGATSLIGDPGGKDAERVLQSEEQVKKNVAAVQKQLSKLFGGQVNFENNLDWFKGMSVLEFLRDVGKHFSMTPLVQRDYIATRMGADGAGISYTEFSYTLLQGYDFLKLNEKYGVSLQLAGSDQWGNCLSGVELVRKVTGNEVHALTMPLIINKTTGKKFGKSEGGAVWLDSAKTTPMQFYQFWINVDDAGAEDYLKIFTEMDKADIAQTMKLHKADPKQRRAQHRLAEEVTELVHGKDMVAKARAATHVLTGVTPLKEAVAAVETLKKEIPVVQSTVRKQIIDVLVEAGLASSKTEARRLLLGGAIYINNEPASKDVLGESDFHNGWLIIRRGKAFKDSALVQKRN